MPVISPGGGTFRKKVTVRISCATSGATIHYTTDGSEPTVGSPVYIGPAGKKKDKGFKLTGKGFYTVRAKAVEAEFNDSAVATAEFTIR